MGKIKKKPKISNTVIQPSINETKDDSVQKSKEREERVKREKRIDREERKLSKLCQELLSGPQMMQKLIEEYANKKNDSEATSHTNLEDNLNDTSSITVADESDITVSDFDISEPEKEDEKRSNVCNNQLAKVKDFSMKTVENDDVIVNYGRFKKKRSFKIKQINTRKITVEFECKEGTENKLKEDITKVFEHFGPIKKITFLYKYALSDEANWAGIGGLMTHIILIEYISAIAARRAFSMEGRKWRNKYPLSIKYTEQFLQPFFLIDTSKSIYISNLAMGIDNNSIYKVFSTCGVIEYVYLMRDQMGICKGNGWVSFMMTESVKKATELNGTIILGRPVLVMKYHSGFFDTDIPMEFISGEPKPDEPPEQMTEEEPEQKSEEEPEQKAEESEEELEEPKAKKIKVSAKNKAHEVQNANFKQKKNKKSKKQKKQMARK